MPVKRKPVKKVSKKPPPIKQLKLTQDQVEKIANELGKTWPEHYTCTHFWDTTCWSCKAPLWYACLTKEDAWGKPLTIKVGSNKGSVTPTCFDGIFLCHNCEHKFERVPFEKIIDKSHTENEKLYAKFVKTTYLPFHITCEHKREDGSTMLGPITKEFFADLKRAAKKKGR